MIIFARLKGYCQALEAAIERFLWALPTDSIALPTRVDGILFTFANPFGNLF